jgi:TRAP-type C4-dicarboxylate transport system permease small subunit
VDTFVKALRFLDRLVLTTLKALTIAIFLLLTVLISANVFVRFVPLFSMHWFDEIIELLYAYLVFFGAAALWISRDHLKIGDWVSGRVIRTPGAQKVYRLALEAIALIFALIFTFYSAKLTALALDVTNVFAIPKKVLYACMPISGALMVVYAVAHCTAALAAFRQAHRPEA